MSMIHAGETYDGIAAALNDSRISTQRGACWTKQAVGRVVKRARDAVRAVAA